MKKYINFSHNIILVNKPYKRKEYYHYFKTPNLTLVISKFKKKFLVVSQKRVPVNKIIYEFPSGMVELNESLVESAERELIEETGYKNQSKMKLISSFFCEPGRLTTKITGYYSDSLIKLQKPEDEIKIHFLNKAEIFKLIKNKKFIHASHICMFFLFLNKFD